MHNLKYIYILLFLNLFLSCREDEFNPDTHDPVNSKWGENEYFFNLSIDDRGVRTRAVPFEPQTALRINQVWVGVFDIEDGSLVAHDDIEMGYQTVTAGVTMKQFLHLNLKAPTTISSKGYIMVCVANHNGVKDQNGNIDLKDKLDEISNWSDFISIAVDTKTAYDGFHSDNTPMLAGFLYDDSKPATSHIKINQFETGTNGVNQEISLSPGVLEDALRLTVSNGKYYTTTTDENGSLIPKTLVTEGASIHLRRLVANINVKINIDNSVYPGLRLDKVDYKRFNLPTHVYIIERRTTNCQNISVDGDYTSGAFPTVASLSPNFSDLDPGLYYTNDESWENVNVSGFSFQHFANKHWGCEEIFKKLNGKKNKFEGNLTQSSREEINKNGAFKALVGEEGLPSNFNNYASYFILRLHLVDEITGMAADAEYTIHEGNTSDELGNDIDDEDGNLQDFIVARNIDYTYEVTIKGFDNIYHKVYKGDNVPDDFEDKAGQGGKIWKLNYLNPDGSKPGYYESNSGSFKNVLGSNGHLFENALTFKSGTTPNIAFRIYGFTDPEECNRLDEHYENFSSDATIQGFNYNFEQESFDKLSGLWPPASKFYSHYIQALDKSDGNVQNPIQFDRIPPDLRGGLRFVENSDEGYPRNGTEVQKIEYFINGGGLDIENFIKRFYNIVSEDQSAVQYVRRTLAKDETYDLYVFESNITETAKKYLDRNNYIRAIYLSDRNGEFDNDRCTQLVNIVVAAQYPDDLSGQEFEIVKSGVNNQDYVSSEPATIIINNHLAGEFLPGIDINGGNGMVFSSERDLAFRLIGFDGEEYFDYCYNFNLEEYPEFQNSWPEARAATRAADFNTLGTQKIEKDDLGSFEFNQSLLDGITVITQNAGELNIKDFIRDHSNDTPISFNVSKYNKTIIGKPDTYKRALYVFDKNAFKRNYVKNSEKNAFYQIYAVEQYPEIKPPTKLDLSKISLPSIWVDKYNILDPLQTFNITVPLLNYIDQNGNTVTSEMFDYKLTIGYYDYSSYGQVSGNNIIFSIPESRLYGSSGNVYLQAISKSDYFTDSDRVTLGNINLKNHAIWKTGDNEAWDAAITYYTNSSNKFKTQTFYHLTFNTNGTDRGFDINSKDLNSGGAAAYISFDVYDECIVKVNAWHNGTRQVKFQVNDKDLFLSDDLQTASGSNIKQCIISVESCKEKNIEFKIGEKNKISIIPSGGGFHYTSIELLRNN